MNSEHLCSPKKLREARAMHGLATLDQLWPTGELRPGVAGREPDFVLETPNGPLGVEIAEYYTPALTTRWRLKERDKLAELILAETTRECNARGISNVFASVEFDDDAEILRKDIPEIIEALASILRPVSSLRLPTLRLRGRARVPRCVADLWAHYREGIDSSFVGRSWGGCVEPVSEQELLRLIAQKEAKLPLYRQHCSAVWLLLIVDQYQPASIGYVPPDYRIAGSTFDRIVVLQGWSYTIDIWRSAA